MNRNQMYDYLKSLGMYPIRRNNSSNQPRTKLNYHIEFVPNREDGQTIDSIIFDWGYVRGADSIHLCANEIVIVAGYERCKINVKYIHINKFEVILDEEY